MKYVKFLVVPVLFVTIAFMNIGSCGPKENVCCVIGPGDCFQGGLLGGECAKFNGKIEHGKCDKIPECSVVPPPTNPPPTDPPPTNPPPQCLVPALNTDFSDRVFLFLDRLNNIVIAVTSTASQDANSSEFQINDLTVAGQPQDTGLIILLADDEIDPDITGLFAIPLDPDLANIITAIIEEDLFVATGDVVRVDNGSVIQINDLNIAGEPQGDDLEGECDSVVDIDTSSTETLRNVILDMKTRGVLKEDGLGD